MKLHRVWAVLLRFLYGFSHSYDRISDAFYWPTIDLLLWGITSTFIQSYAPENLGIITMIVSGILFWIIIWRGQYEITVNLLEELWNRNLINLFVAPLKFSEWIAAFVIIGIVKAIASITFASFVAFILYKVNIFQYGFYLLPFILLLIMTGWWVGFLVSGVILRFGTKVQVLAWTTAAVISPFSAVYYPLSILPDWAQKIGLVIPTTYIFEGARSVVARGYLDMNAIWISLALSIVYLVLALIFLRKSFNKVLQKGLIKVY